MHRLPGPTRTPARAGVGMGVVPVVPSLGPFPPGMSSSSVLPLVPADRLAATRKLTQRNSKDEGSTQRKPCRARCADRQSHCYSMDSMPANSSMSGPLCGPTELMDVGGPGTIFWCRAQKNSSSRAPERTASMRAAMTRVASCPSRATLYCRSLTRLEGVQRLPRMPL